MSAQAELFFPTNATRRVIPEHMAAFKDAKGVRESKRKRQGKKNKKP